MWLARYYEPPIFDIGLGVCVCVWSKELKTFSPILHARVRKATFAFLSTKLWNENQIEKKRNDNDKRVALLYADKMIPGIDYYSRA